MTEAGRVDGYRHWGWPPAFGSGIAPAAAFVLAFSLVVMASNVLATVVLGPSPSNLVEQLWNIASGVVQVGIAVGVLRYEGVRLRDLGLGRREFRSAIVAVGGFLVVLNVVVAGLLVLEGGDASIAPYALYLSAPLEYSLPALAVTGVAQYVFVGPVEELAFRGYLQNKLVTALGIGTVRLRTALGILGAAVVFAALHVPTLFVLEGVQVGGLVGSLAVLSLSGIAFGTIYALTRNLYLVGMLHGVGNLWPLVVDPGIEAWPNWGVVFVLYALLVVVYRQWGAVPSRRTPPTDG